MSAYEIVRLTPPADVARLQRFLERCADYYLLHEACATPPDAGEYELSVVPPGRTPDESIVLAMIDASGEVAAVAQFLPDYPRAADWWIGLLLVLPELRGRGLGRQLLDEVERSARAAGAQWLRLAVSTSNPRGHAFWRAAGFHDSGEQVRITARGGHVDTGEYMFRELTAPGETSTPPHAP